jgi:lipopolysaccharide/colanic/teichoic acid biosynthesis glycosyltransferase
MFTDKGRMGRRVVRSSGAGADVWSGQGFAVARHDTRAAATLAGLAVGDVALAGAGRGGAAALAQVTQSAESTDRFEEIDLAAGPGWRWHLYQEVKFAVEWLTAVLLLAVASPLLLTLAAAVKFTSDGPAFYAQTRLGRGGRRYRIYKLRTMVHNAEAGTGPVWAALSGDSRITPIGRFLRKTHLDELPQLINVLKGEMGLIGPRPERPEIAGQIKRRVPDYDARLAVRPGVTGLAQMLLPADDPTDAGMAGVRRKLACDKLYVQRSGALMDIRVAIVTPCHFIAEAASAIGGPARPVRSLMHRVRRGLIRGYAMDAGVEQYILDLERADEVPAAAPQDAPARTTVHRGGFAAAAATIVTDFASERPCGCESAA